MELDFTAMQESEKKHAEESKQAIFDGLQAMTKKEQERQAEINRLFAKAHEQESKRKQQEMERKIEEETAAAVEAIRAKYEKEAPAEWNESKTTKAYRKLAKSLIR